MRGKEVTSAFELAALAQAIELAKNEYLKTKDTRLAAAALVLTELALRQADDMLQGGETAKNES